MSLPFKPPPDPNPLLKRQTEFLQSLNPTAVNNFFSPATLSPSERAEIWEAQATLGEELVDQYAWATPDERALNILRHFAPIIEIGCGKNGYWAKMMKNAGIDVEAYDCDPERGGLIGGTDGDGDGKEKKDMKRCDIEILKGGPDVLKNITGRTLFLCYPDEDYQPFNTSSGDDNDDNDNDDDDDCEDENNDSIPVHHSLGGACLEYYQGDIVIHVGELYGDTLSMEQAPWGRSSGSEFQERLAGEYHCLLKVGLKSWLHVRDTLSVWKRSQRCSMIFQGDNEDEDDEDEELEYRHVPMDERLPVDVAAPCVAHLLNGGNDDKKRVKVKGKCTENMKRKADKM